MKRIIVPIDFTEVSRAGIEHAIEVALKNDSSLILIHVLSYLSEKDAQTNFDAMVSSYPLLKEIPHRTVVADGERIQMLLDAVNTERADFMIIATKGAENDYDEVSIAYQMIAKSNIPVLVVPYKVKYQEINKILYTSDYKSIKDTNILKNLHQLAKSYDAKVHVLYVGEKEEIEKGEREQMENTLEYFLETIEHSYDFFNQTDIEKGISEFIKEKGIDLMAMVSRRRNKNPSKMKQSLVREIALHTKIPLLTLPEM